MLGSCCSGIGGSPFQAAARRPAFQSPVYASRIETRGSFVQGFKRFWSRSQRPLGARQLPDEPYGPARRELAKCVAEVAGGTLDTILLGDLSFPEEAGKSSCAGKRQFHGQAIRPLLLNAGLTEVKLMENPLEKPEATREDPDPKPRPSPETPYPTTICKAGLSQVHFQLLSVPGTLDSPSDVMLLQDWEGSLLPKRTDTIMLIPGTKDLSKAG